MFCEPFDDAPEDGPPLIRPEVGIREGREKLARTMHIEARSPER